jgi:hypothetical protein
MNGTIVVAPWLIGLVANSAGTNTAICTGIRVGFFTGLVNSPLMFRKGLGKKAKKAPTELCPLVGENEELLKKVLGGEYVDPDIVNHLN